MTKKQRNEAYRWAYASVEVREAGCICWSLEDYDYVNLHHFDQYTEMIETVFPEMWLFKPDKKEGGWWFELNLEGKNERLTCLAFCIAMTED